MQERELFGALLRILGIWFLYDAVYDVIFLFTHFSTPLENTVKDAIHLKIMIGFHFLLALVLLSRTGQLVRLFYGPISKADRPQA